MSDVELKPANQNPWYVLMTLYGEQTGEEVDETLHARNRRVWNAWACQGLETADRAMWDRVDQPDWFGWEVEASQVMKDHETAMLVRNGPEFQYPGFPDVAQKIEMQKVHFTHKFVASELLFLMSADFGFSTFESTVIFNASRFVNDARFNFAIFKGYTSFSTAAFMSGTWFFRASFVRPTRFTSTNFHRIADFSCTIFQENVRFSDAIFQDEANFYEMSTQKTTRFNRTKFFGVAMFAKADFCEWVSFLSAEFNDETFFVSARFGGEAFYSNARFKGDIRFDNAEFLGELDFKSVMFDGYVYFTEALFKGHDKHSRVDFTDSQFMKPTNFRDAQFFNAYPEFAGAILHDKTVFPARQANWPVGKQKNSQQAKASCAVMRQVMGKQGLPEEEHFFYRREMMFSQRGGPLLQRPLYWAFGLLSEYGYGISIPLVWLALLVASGPWVLVPGLAGNIDFWQGLGLSFSNVFNFLGFQKSYFDPKIVEAMPRWVKVFSGFQTLAGLVLLFFFGLGLRTRFRLR